MAILALRLKTEKESISKELVGAAAVHYVASELSFRGMIALPTIRNTAGYDLIIVSADGKRHANIQVKYKLRHLQTVQTFNYFATASGP